MKTITLSIPDQLDLSDYDIKISLAVKLYESGKCSIGQAAEIVGLSKRAFIETMGIYGGSIFSKYSKKDLEHDLKHA